MVAIKTITVRLPGIIYERLCELAEISQELPSGTARRILKEFLANLGIAKLDQKSSKTEEPSRLELKLYRVRIDEAGELARKFNHELMPVTFARGETWLVNKKAEAVRRETPEDVARKEATLRRGMER